MKRNLILLFAVWVAILMAGSGAQGKAPQKAPDPISRIALFSKTLRQDQAQIIGWSVFAREEHSSTVTRQEFAKTTDYAMKDQPGFSWRFAGSHNGVLSWSGIKTEPSGLKISLTYFAYPAGKMYRTATLYQAQAGAFNPREWPNQQQNMRRSIAKIFHGQKHIFSCVRAYDSDKMKLGLLNQGDRYLKLFSAAPIERLNEKTFVSISAYNNAWNDSINSGNRQMNFQVALRNDGERTIITMGTPIITLEY